MKKWIHNSTCNITSSESDAYKLKATWTDIDYQPHTRTFSGSNLQEALVNLIGTVHCYLDVVDAEEMSSQEILDHLNDVNGDGCDYITKLIDVTTGEVLMDYVEDEYYE